MTRAGAHWATPHRSAAALATPWCCHAPKRGLRGGSTSEQIKWS